jgi:hypothetical protein
MTRSEQIAKEIEALQAQIHEKRRELDAIAETQRIADLDALIARLPPEVLDLLRQDEPRPEDMKRLVPRGLATATNSGGRFRFVRRTWTRLRGDILARLDQTGA